MYAEGVAAIHEASTDCTELVSGIECSYNNMWCAIEATSFPIFEHSSASTSKHHAPMPGQNYQKSKPSHTNIKIEFPLRPSAGSPITV